MGAASLSWFLRLCLTSRYIYSTNMPLYSLTGTQYRGFVRFFNQSQNNNILGKRELAGILSKYNLNPSDSELQQMIDAVSVDSQGITWEAFIDYVSTWTGFRDQEQEYAEAFRIYDRSGTGELSREDIRYVLNKLGTGITEAEITALIDEADINKDGAIQYDEFVKLMKKKF